MHNNNCSSENDIKRKGRIFLLYPPCKLVEKRNYPIDLMYLASISESVGLEAKIWNGLGDVLDAVKEFSPDYILANMTTQSFRSDMETLYRIKSELPSIRIIVKGAPFLAYNTNVIYENYFIDYVIIGEAEQALSQILSGVEDKDILGICYRENEQGVKNDLSPFNQDLDSLPFPERHLVDKSLYKSILNNQPQATVEVSRGCPNNCFFCLASSMSGLKFRARTVDNIISEIKECIEKFGIKNFFFKSNNFNYDRSWVIDFCKKIIENKLDIIWQVELIPSSIDDEMVDLMYKSGCRLVYFGVESGSAEILKNIGKNTNLDEIRAIVKRFKSHKIRVHNNFLFGLPWETQTTAEETIKFALELDSDFASFNISSPFPGTRHFAYSMMNKLVEENLNFDNAYKEPVVKSHELSKDKILEIKKEAEIRYQNRHNIFFKLKQKFVKR